MLLVHLEPQVTPVRLRDGNVKNRRSAVPVLPSSLLDLGKIELWWMEHLEFVLL